ILTCKNCIPLKFISGRLFKAFEICLVTSPQIVLVGKNTGFDSLSVELEHSILSLEDAGKLCCMGLAAGMMLFVRLPHQTGSSDIDKILGAGDMVVIVLYIQDANM
ncbi:hypothetical protein IWW34DRAFT_637068, partial [Fusarium oxysporum f. sp. albedinis]